VKLLDASVLLHAYNADSPHHAVCRTWLESVFNDGEIIALPWQTILTFVRIVTSPRAVRQPLTGEVACQIVSQWLARPNVTVVGQGGRFWGLLRGQISTAQAGGALVGDAALAAVALEQGATLCSTDTDFQRFPGLKVINPLEGQSS
jgi:toxin-antitoxin system PIN domain toxin